MATIEERAEKWAIEYIGSGRNNNHTLLNNLIIAYLAGSAQTQKDYTASEVIWCDYHDRHHLPGEFNYPCIRGIKPK